MSIETLTDVVRERGWNSERFDKYDLGTIVGNIQSRLERRLSEGESFSLTSLQRKALNSEEFWDSRESDIEAPRHLIVQGATSAGKTLLSELAILDVLAHQGQALVLVPLKAMVRERTEHFKQDIENCAHEYHVYGSSSDYLDNDERLINGEYNVGVLVYEKLFSMLNQPDCGILKHCRLVVVDELSMLSKEDRGPKLEVALEIVRRLRPDARIMCLSTCDCGVKNVAKWLGAGDGRPCEVIFSSERPLGLNEYLVKFDGTYRFRSVPSEREKPDAVEKPSEGKIDVPGFCPDDNTQTKQRNLLLAILRKVHHDQPDARILVFVASRAKAAAIARFVKGYAADLFPKVDLTDEERGEIDAKLAACDADDERSELEELLPHRIAFHHAGISASLREFVEEEFGRHLRLVVATETLTVGVNLPFDVMIMMDFEIRRGGSEASPVSYQEYRNFIGRAGRLGQSNQAGTSYLMVNDPYYLDWYWDGFSRVEQIDSALRGAEGKDRVPFYLGLIYGTSSGGTSVVFDRQRIESLHRDSFAYACGQIESDAESVAEELEDVYLCTRQGGGRRRRGSDPTFALNSLGTALAPYALSTDTCLLIHHYFAGGATACETYVGLPVGTSARDIESDRYLLEILFHVCLHGEVDQLSTLSVPDDKRRAAHQLVRAMLRRMVSPNGEETEFPGNDLWATSRVEDEDCLIDLLGNVAEMGAGEQKTKAAIRAIVLYFWTQGKTIKEIARLTGFQAVTRIVAGDLERLADVVSYHLEAINQCLAVAEDEGGNPMLAPGASREFRSLQVRVRYGMDRGLTVLASRHVHGLDRSRILRLGKIAVEKGCSPLEAIYVLPDEVLETCVTRHQLSVLRERVTARFSMSRPEALKRAIEQDLRGSLDEEQNAALTLIWKWGSEDGDGVSGTLLKKMIKKLLGNHLRFEFHLDEVEGDTGLLEWVWKGEETEFIVAPVSSDEDVSAMVKALEKERRQEKILVISNNSDSLEGFVRKLREVRIEEVLAMDSVFFSLVLETALLFSQRDMVENGLEDTGVNGVARALASFFSDAVGVFTERDVSSFSLVDYLPSRPSELAGHQPVLRLVCSRGGRVGSGYHAYSWTRLRAELEDDASFEGAIDVPDWCQLASDLKNDPSILDGGISVIYLERSRIQRSRALTIVMNALYQRAKDEKDCLVVFDSKSGADEWDGGRPGERPVVADACIRWNNQLCRLPRFIATTCEDAAREICDFVQKASSQGSSGFLIGVSYAHYNPGVLLEDDGADKRGIKDCFASWRDLVDALAQRYGSDRILFDAYHEHLFQGFGAQERTLKMYETCRLYVVLDTIWTEANENCKKEIEVMRKRCKEGKADLLVLTPSAPSPYAGRMFSDDQAYTTPLDVSPEDFLNTVAEKLRRFNP